MSDDDKTTELDEILKQLSPRERKVLKERFGIDVNTATAPDEITRRFDITRQRIREIEERALKKLSSDDPDPDDAA